MNLHYPVPEREHRFMLWLLVAALLIANVFLALRLSDTMLVNFADPVTISTSHAAPRAVPVPEPPLSQPAASLRSNATPVPAETLLRPAPQPVPTPPVNP